MKLSETLSEVNFELALQINKTDKHIIINPKEGGWRGFGTKVQGSSNETK
jgi:hypothetical protein